MKKNIVIGLFLVGILLMIIYLLPQNDPREKIIKEFVHKIYEVNEKVYAESKIEEKNGHMEVEKWAQRRFKMYLTNDAFEMAIKNRILTQGLILYKNNGYKPVHIKELTIVQKESNRYAYKIVFDTNFLNNTYEGIIYFNETNSLKITNITRTMQSRNAK